MNFRSIAVLSFVLWGTISCSSVPLSATVRMSSFDGKDFSALNPKSIRVRIEALGNPYMVSHEAIMEGVLGEAYRFELKQVETMPIDRNTGFFSRKEVGNSTVYKLSQRDVEIFHELALQYSSLEESKFTYNVSATFEFNEGFNKDFSDLSMSVYILLKEYEDYFPLLKNVKFNSSGGA